MAVSEKINALLQIRGVKKYELAEFLEMSPQSLRNKFNRGSFSAEDLIKISGFLFTKFYPDNYRFQLSIQERRKTKKIRQCKNTILLHHRILYISSFIPID